MSQLPATTRQAPPSSTGPINALTVDVEDYFQVSAFEGIVKREDWDSYPSRVVANTQRMLRVFAKRNVQGTFFVLGWIAKKFPELVREIDSAGHEIACHSYWHRLVYSLTPEEFRADLTQARDVLQEITGKPVVGFRAPSFSITERSLWALEILAEEGFKQDSSIFPVYHDRYGIPTAERFLHRLPAEQGGLWEFPPSVHRWASVNLPVAGGGYFRLYPLWLTRRCFRQINAMGHSAIFYIHPWELDPDQPRVAVSLSRRIRHYVNLKTTEAKLDRLLGDLRFGTLSAVLAESMSGRAALAGPHVSEPSHCSQAGM